MNRPTFDPVTLQILWNVRIARHHRLGDVTNGAR